MKPYLQDMLDDPRVTAVWIYKDADRRPDPPASVTVCAAMYGQAFAVTAHHTTLQSAITDVHSQLQAEFDDRK